MIDARIVSWLRVAIVFVDDSGRLMHPCFIFIFSVELQLGFLKKTQDMGDQTREPRHAKRTV